MRGIAGFGIAALVAFSLQARADTTEVATCFTTIGGKAVSGGKTYTVSKKTEKGGNGKEVSYFTVTSSNASLGPADKKETMDLSPAVSIFIERKGYLSFSYDFGESGFAVASLDFEKDKTSFLDLRVLNNKVSTSGAVELSCSAPEAK